MSMVARDAGRHLPLAANSRSVPLPDGGLMPVAGSLFCISESHRRI